MAELHACCEHCDPGDDFHVMWGRDDHDDPCPEGCNHATPRQRKPRRDG